MRSLPFPRRLQLVKLLRAHGLRDVERMREDELKDALSRLSLLLPDLQRTLPMMSAPCAPMSASMASGCALGNSSRRVSTTSMVGNTAPMAASTSSPV